MTLPPVPNVNRYMEARSIRYNDTFSEKWVVFLSPLEWRGRVDLEYRSVPISQIQHAGCAIDPDVVHGWMVAMHEGVPIPPPVATVTERGTYYLHDGNHRFDALRNVLSPDATVRVAVVKPLAGYRFARVPIGDTYTYILQEKPSVPVYVRAITAGVALSTLAIGLTHLTPGSDVSPFFVFMLASVFLCVRWFGWLAGLAATVLNSACAAFFLLPPIYSLRVEDSHHAVQLFITMLTMLLVTAIFAEKRQSQILRGR